MKKFVARLVSVIAIAALIFPSISLGFGGSQTSVRKTNASQEIKSPNAKAPLPYSFGERPSVLERFSESASKIADAAVELTEPHDLPSDFNRPEEYSSFSSRLAALIRRVGMELGLAGPKGREIDANPSVSVPSSVEFDFDGDNVADFARWEPSTGEWKIKNSNGGSYSTDTLGDSNSIIAPGDFNGDGTTDVAVFKGGTWTIHPSGGSAYTASYGAAGDKPVVGDYDGDGTSDVSVFRPSNATWYIYNSSTSTTTSVAFGAATDIPVQGDYNGDGKTDVAVYRPGDGVWHILPSGGTYYGYSWGAASDIPVPEDYDGDGKTDYAVWRPDSGTWYVVKSSNLSQTYVVPWGNYGDQPAPADYDGDGRAEMTVWRPKTGTWFAYDSCNYDSSCGGGATYFTETLGVAGDTPVAAAYLKKSGAFVQEYDFSQTRLSPKNATGGTNLYSRNFSWGTTLVSLPGRAGLDAGIGVGYNSLVWIKDPSNSTMVFEPDGSNVAPGFNFGFPEIEPVYYDSTTQKYSYLMVTPSGSRIEFRQAAAKNEYETADSSYLLLKTVNAEDPNDPVGSFEITVTDTNGTVMTFEWNANAYRLKEIKDRNGNYITVSHNEYGLLEWVKDTLGRIINVNYDSSLYPVSITQQWKDNNGAGSAVTRTYATFEYSDITVNPSFTGLAIYGPSNGTVKVLSKIIYGTSGSNLGDTRFEYNTFGQVKKVRNLAADGHELNYTATNLDTPGTGLTDVPRLSQTRTWFENFNIVGGSPQEVVVNNTLTESQNYSFPGSISGSGTLIEVSMVDHPDEFISRTYVGDSGWQEGLPIATEDCVDDDCQSSRKRWSWNVWTQDNENLNYILNPRIEETWVGDDENGNVLRTVLTYEMVDADVSKFGLVNKVQLIDTSASMVLKETETTYNLNAAYTSRRIIGLPSEILSKGHDGTSLNLVGKITYGYDEDSFDHEDLEQDISPIEHDTGFGTGFVSGRGNLTSITRWDVTDDTNSSLAVSREIFYDIAGSIVGIVTPDPNSSSGRLTEISYQDNFSDTSTSRNTFAYPTTVTDSGGNPSTNLYRYDFGANVQADGPVPAGNSKGAELKREFDTFGRLQKQIVGNTGAYTRYEYPTSGIHSKVFATLVDTNSNSVADSSDEILTEVWIDGGGRAIAAVSEHPGSTGGFTGRIIEYDVLGRESRSTLPTEVNSSFAPSGDDASGWLWKHTKYDWRDRVVRKINTDGTDSPSLNPSDVVISYEGCGCAGGLEITVQGEEIIETDYQGNNPVSLGRRTRKVFQDMLGRTVLTQIMEWNGTSVYSETETSYNGRDQASTITQYAVENGQRTDSQVTSMTYDGHGRLSTRHRPEQSSGTNTAIVYNADDSVHSVTDARGATTTYTYEERGLVSDIDYSVPQGSSIQVPPSVEFEYDAAGNRTVMTDGMGTVTYAVSELSQLVSETRAFNETLADAPISNNSYKLEYTYTLGGQLKSLKDPFGQRFDYAHDETGRLVSVTGAIAFGGVTDYADNPGYRAWGALKHLEFGNGTEADITFDNRFRPTSYSLTDGGSTDHIDKTYSYYADGNLKYIQDGINSKHDDFYKFDQKGRLLEGLSAVEARGGTETDLEELPYRHIYEYDRFDNITEYEITNWDVSETESFTYTNHRRDGLPSSAYDEEGNRKSGKWLDAAGQNTYFYEGWANLVRVWDGDGREIKRINKVYDFVEEDYLDPDIAYYIRSTVLGGQIITEVDDTGAKAQTYVWAGGSIVARQLMLGEDHDEETVVWDYKDAVRSTTKYLDDEGDDVSTSIDILQSGEYDPKGGFVMPYYFPPNPHAGQTNTRQRVPSPLFELNAGGCSIMLDGVASSCDLLTDYNITFSVQIRVGVHTFISNNIQRDLPGGGISVFIPGRIGDDDSYLDGVYNEEDGVPPRIPDEVGGPNPGYWVVLDFSWTSTGQVESTSGETSINSASGTKKCIFNIELRVPQEWEKTDTVAEVPNNLIPGETVTEKGFLYRIKEGLRKAFEEVGLSLVFNDKKAASGTKDGSVVLTYKKKPSLFRKMLGAGDEIFGSYWNGRAAVYTDRVGLDVPGLIEVGLHETGHKFLNGYPRNDDDGHSEGFMVRASETLDLGKILSFSEDQATYLRSLCNQHPD